MAELGGRPKTGVLGGSAGEEQESRLIRGPKMGTAKVAAGLRIIGRVWKEANPTSPTFVIFKMQVYPLALRNPQPQRRETPPLKGQTHRPPFRTCGSIRIKHLH